MSRWDDRALPVLVALNESTDRNLRGGILPVGPGNQGAAVLGLELSDDAIHDTILQLGDLGYVEYNDISYTTRGSARFIGLRGQGDSRWHAGAELSSRLAPVVAESGETESASEELRPNPDRRASESGGSEAADHPGGALHRRRFLRSRVVGEPADDLGERRGRDERLERRPLAENLEAAAGDAHCRFLVGGVVMLVAARKRERREQRARR